MQTRLQLLLLWIALIASISGCASTAKVVLHPIEKTDIQAMKKGEAYAPEKDGFFLSSLYMNEVLEARVEKGKNAA